MEGFRLKTGHYYNNISLERKEKVESWNEFTERNAPEIIGFFTATNEDKEYNI